MLIKYLFPCTTQHHTTSHHTLLSSPTCNIILPHLSHHCISQRTTPHHITPHQLTHHRLPICAELHYALHIGWRWSPPGCKGKIQMRSLRSVKGTANHYDVLILLSSTSYTRFHIISFFTSIICLFFQFTSSNLFLSINH